MTIFLVILHILVCMALILIVLLQTGKGADLGAAFGGSSQTVFGSAGSSGFMTKLTTASAIIFMITSLALVYMKGHTRDSSLISEAVERQEKEMAEVGEPLPFEDIEVQVEEQEAAPAEGTVDEPEAGSEEGGE
ncbi:preprotein translocase subunit SecG [Thermodesulfobacteriota bacterium]